MKREKSRNFARRRRDGSLSLGEFARSFFVRNERSRHGGAPHSARVTFIQRRRVRVRARFRFLSEVSRVGWLTRQPVQTEEAPAATESPPSDKQRPESRERERYGRVLGPEVESLTSSKGSVTRVRANSRSSVFSRDGRGAPSVPFFSCRSSSCRSSFSRVVLDATATRRPTEFLSSRGSPSRNASESRVRRVVPHLRSFADSGRSPEEKEDDDDYDDDDDDGERQSSARWFGKRAVRFALVAYFRWKDSLRWCSQVAMKETLSKQEVKREWEDGRAEEDSPRVATTDERSVESSRSVITARRHVRTITTAGHITETVAEPEDSQHHRRSVDDQAQQCRSRSYQDEQQQQQQQQQQDQGCKLSILQIAHTEAEMQQQQQQQQQQPQQQQQQQQHARSREQSLVYMTSNGQEVRVQVSETVDPSVLTVKDTVR